MERHIRLRPYLDGIRLHAHRVGPEESARCRTYWSYQRWYMFGSEHPHRVFFAFGDGAVRGIDDNIDWQAFLDISGMRDGRLVPSEQVGF